MCTDCISAIEHWRRHHLSPIQEYVYQLIENIANELDFIKMVVFSSYYETEHNNDKAIALKRFNVVIQMFHIIFVLLVLMDLILTNLYSNSAFPFYTISIQPSFQWEIWNSPQLIFYIMFCVALCCCCSVCVSWTYSICNLLGCCISNAYDSSSNDSAIGMCFMGIFSCLLPPLVLLVFLSLLTTVFCVSPSLLLYLVFLVYIRVNSVQILALKIGINQTPWNYAVDAVHRAVDSISNNYTYYPLFHRRFAQYIAAFILWPIDDENYEQITGELLKQMKLLFNTEDENETMKHVQTMHLNQFIDKNEFHVEQKLLRMSMAMKGRIQAYIIFCILSYALVYGAFWSCYILFDFSGEIILNIFCIFSYVLYAVLLVSSMIVLKIQFTAYLKEKYEWLLIATSGSNGKLNQPIGFSKKSFCGLYYSVMDDFIFQKTVTKLFDHQHEWFLKLILEYTIADLGSVLNHMKQQESYDHDVVINQMVQQSCNLKVAWHQEKIIDFQSFNQSGKTNVDANEHTSLLIVSVNA